MADVPVLVCTSGKLSGKRIVVPEGGLGLGRSPENAVVVQDQGVSRYHARLLYENGSLWLQDAGSRNGVFVNGVRVTGHKALKVGDSVTIAEHSFELRWQDADATIAARDAAREATRLAEGEAAAGARDAGAEDEPESTTPTGRRRWFWPFS